MSHKEMMAKEKAWNARAKEYAKAMRRLIAESKALEARIKFLVGRVKAGTASEEEVAALRRLSDEEMPAMRARLLQMFPGMKDGQ